MSNDNTTASAAAPEEGGDTSEELAYRLRQQELVSEFGRYALRTHDTNALLQEASRICALGLHSDFCKVMKYLPEESSSLCKPASGGSPAWWAMPAPQPIRRAR